ncbi:MAG: hypothetical protein GKR89_31940 [Candidatus Latescibacteria bacterium]|nr:hypothetical protein [Candidatus Latescibacterota bacterium]
MEGPVRVGVVGMGGFARTHLGYVEQVVGAGLGVHLGQVVLPADQETFAPQTAALRDNKVAIYPSLRDMLATARQQLDLVCVPVGIPWHRPMVEAVLEAGCHVLVEKPAAGSVQDIDAMIAAQRRTGGLAALGFQHLYASGIQRLKDWLCQGHLGPLKRARAAGSWPRPPAYYQRNGWAGRRAVGDAWVLDSPHHNALAHAVNLLCYLGSLEKGQALSPARLQGELYRANSIDSADTVCLRMQTEEGVEVFFAASHCTDRRFDPLFVFEGERGQLEVAYSGEARVLWGDGRVEELSGDADQEREGILEDICAAIRDKRPLACPLEVGRAQVVCTCGTFESAPVRDLPAELLQVQGDEQIVVAKGMTELLQGAFAEGRLFAEMGVDWARPGQEIDLRDYAYFPSFRPPVG